VQRQRTGIVAGETIERMIDHGLRLLGQGYESGRIVIGSPRFQREVPVGGKQMDQDLATMIGDIIDGKGHRLYGLSSVNQRAHALQAALLAEQEGSNAALIVASLLHDIGHMVHDLGENPAERGIDDKHEELGQVWLQRWFGPEVTEPVRLHVAAKRYLCAAEPDYFSRLSPDSVRSLDLQGGPMSPDELAEYRANPYAAAATALRRFDECAKVKGLETPPASYFLKYVAECARKGG
jgi:[1-hydroxy-2-(trimethylamino)ethyl]phosphonate dioxygenase